MPSAGDLDQVPGDTEHSVGLLTGHPPMLPHRLLSQIGNMCRICLKSAKSLRRIWWATLESNQAWVSPAELQSAAAPCSPSPATRCHGPGCEGVDTRALVGRQQENPLCWLSAEQPGGCRAGALAGAPALQGLVLGPVPAHQGDMEPEGRRVVDLPQDVLATTGAMR